MCNIYKVYIRYGHLYGYYMIYDKASGSSHLLGVEAFLSACYVVRTRSWNTVASALGGMRVRVGDGMRVMVGRGRE